MTLFITGATLRSTRAIANVRAFCTNELANNVDLEVVDLCETPARAKDDQVIAAPTLVRYQPQPARRLIGDMSDQGRLRALMKVA